ncbi:hypothetical protein AB9P05_04545 [Roseivirga sp. BDSF3-8]|uniref:hypothetical protein n=1 Tax=Roseivirga sp. BDSF3-8 TaxID=3241598 RepID=UPI003531CCB3
MNQNKADIIHLGIAEQGKLYALKNNHQEALRHYREALKMVSDHKAHELFAQHYLQCTMESLELSGAYDEVITYCHRLLQVMGPEKPESPFLMRHMAATLERLAVQHLLKKEKEEARKHLERIKNIAGPGIQPLADQLLNWLQRGYTIRPGQIRDAQKKHRYFIVQQDKVKPEIAIDLKNLVTDTSQAL